jgi:hypothetical protein
LNSPATLAASASHICIAGASSWARCASKRSMFLPAWAWPVKNSTTLCCRACSVWPSCTTATMPEVLIALATGLTPSASARALGHQAEHLHGRVIAVQQRRLRGLHDQRLEDRTRCGHGLGDDVPLGRIGQRHVQRGLQALEPEVRHAVAVPEQGDLSHSRQRSRCSLYTVAPSGAQAHHLDDGPGRRVVDAALVALRAAVA